MSLFVADGRDAGVTAVDEPEGSSDLPDIGELREWCDSETSNLPGSVEESVAGGVGQIEDGLERLSCLVVKKGEIFFEGETGAEMVYDSRCDEGRECVQDLGRVELGAHDLAKEFVNVVGRTEERSERYGDPEVVKRLVDRNPRDLIPIKLDAVVVCRV